MIARCGTLLFGLMSLLPASAQPTPSSAGIGLAPDNSNAVCVEKLQMPSYPPLARQARIAGTLSVTVNLGPDGAVARVSATSDLNNDRAQPLMLTPVEDTLRKAQFRRDCGGKQLTLVYEFRIAGDPYDRQQGEVAFGYPNRFWITVRPPIPNTNP